MGDEAGLVELGALVERDDGGHRLAEALVGQAYHAGVGDPGRGLEHLLDLLGVHLLAGGVDARRAPAEQRDGALLGDRRPVAGHHVARSEEHTSELQSLMRISYAVFCLKKKKKST